MHSQAHQAKQAFLHQAQTGILTTAIPTSPGGQGLGFRALCKQFMTLGQASLDLGLSLSLQAHLWGAIFPIGVFCHQSTTTMLAT